MRCTVVALTGLLLVGSVALADGPATRPSQPASPTAPAADLTFNAKQAFNRGQYAIALPLLQKAAVAVKDQPDELGQVQEMIKVSQTAIAKANLLQNATPIDPAAATATATRTPHATPVPGKVQVMEIKDLGNFDYDQDKGGNIPDDVKAMNGSTIRLKGYMIPIDQAERISKFALVPSLFACCFGQPPQIQHTIVVDCPPGKSVNYYPDELTVEGTLSVDEKKEDDVITSIFEIKTTSVKPAAK